MLTLQTVTVDHSLSQVIYAGISLFDLLDSDVFALGQLDQVLDTVNDVKLPLLVHRGHIPRPEPTVIGEGLLGLLLILKVSGEHVGSTHEQLSSWAWLVRRAVAQVGAVLQAKLQTRLRWAD